MPDAADRWISWLGIRVTIYALCAALTFVGLGMQGCGDGRDPDRPKPPPAPFFTSDAGQKWVKIPAHDLEWWLEKHGAARIISLGARDWDNQYIIVYEEAE